jgi:predicted TIM-barrel fold metal-dependent hydrolase
VDFLRPYAWAEVQRCRAELQSPGIKLHLGSAGANLGYASHLSALHRFAELASLEGLILFVHFDPQNNRGNLADIRRFIDQVLQPFPDLTVVIAHLGGSGGFDAWTRAIFQSFSAWLDEEAAAGRPRPGVHFDISAVWLAQDSEGMPRSSKQDGEALAAELARIGVSRMVFGSDAPVFVPGPYAAAFRRRAGLGPEAWDTLARNRLPALATATSR